MCSAVTLDNHRFIGLLAFCFRGHFSQAKDISRRCFVNSYQIVNEIPVILPSHFFFIIVSQILLTASFALLKQFFYMRRYFT